jgi:hypothetical protein
MRLMNTHVIPLYELRARRKGYEVSVIKEMMNVCGFAAGPVRPPLPQLRPEDVDQGESDSGTLETLSLINLTLCASHGLRRGDVRFNFSFPTFTPKPVLVQIIVPDKESISRHVSRTKLARH